MALNDEGAGMVMPVAPMYGGGYGMNNGGFGGMDGNGWWIVLLFILLAGGRGWGGGFGGWGGENGGTVVVDNNAGVQRGFDQAAVMSGINGLQSGINGLSTQMCNGFAGVNATVNNGFAQAEIAANGRQMANMQTAFAGQTAMIGGFNNLAAELANCCCENRLGTADLKYTIATENCADRAALSDGVRDIIAAQTAGIQSIKDQLCADKIDAKNDLIAQLRQELLFARGQASQDVQTAAIRAGQVAEIDAMYNRLRDCPVPTMPVYGMTPIFTCNGNNGGCGCGNSGF